MRIMEIYKEMTKQDLVVYSCMAAFMVLGGISMNMLITMLMLVLAGALFWYSTQSKFTLLLKIFSIFVLLHFIVFPYVYVVILKTAPKSFQIDSEIEDNELVIAQQEINERYELKILENGTDIALKLLNSMDTYLDSSFHYLNNDNILYMDTFMLHKSTVYKDMGHPSAGFSTLSICNSKGQNMVNLIGEYGNCISDEMIISEFLSKQIKAIGKANSKLDLDKDKINNKDIWSYRRILAYSINIFDTDNLKPKSKLANIIFFIHKLIVWIFIVGIIGSALHDFVNDNKKE